MPAEATSAMNDQYEKVMRDSFLTNLKTINEINKCKMEVTREFWQQMHDSKACTCNRCGASSRGTADPHDYRRVVLLLPEFPIIINVRSWWCEGCQVRNILKLIESFLFYIILWHRSTFCCSAELLMYSTFGAWNDGRYCKCLVSEPPVLYGPHQYILVGHQANAKFRTRFEPWSRTLFRIFLQNLDRNMVRQWFPGLSWMDTECWPPPETI